MDGGYAVRQIMTLQLRVREFEKSIKENYTLRINRSISFQKTTGKQPAQ